MKNICEDKTAADFAAVYRRLPREQKSGLRFILDLLAAMAKEEEKEESA